MPQPTDERVARFLDDIRLLDPSRFELVQTLRKLILGLDPTISEAVKYGGILFSAGKPFCGIFSYARHVTLEFGDGASLPDPFHMLAGEGKQRRHIKLLGIEDIAAKHVPDYLELARKAAKG